MVAAAPQELQKQFLTYFNAGDLDALMDLYEPDALFVGIGGEEALGSDAVRAALGGLLSLPELSFSYTPTFSAQSDNVVLMHATWSLTGRGPYGSAVAMSGVTVEVARRGEDGGWRYVVDCPFGSAAVPAGGSREQ